LSVPPSSADSSSSAPSSAQSSDFDLLVVGGGINGAGIARDAAGRGLRVLLVEKGDIAGATSSWSSKLIHGGLRYLEQYQFRLVSEALGEREVLLRIAGHLVWPCEFVMPHVRELRPRWMIRLGLFFYDHLARRDALPACAPVRLDQAPYNAGLRAGLVHGFRYADCRVDDARLVIANARGARALGAGVLARTELQRAERRDGRWNAVLRDAQGAERTIRARAVVNATGPWVKQVLNDRLGQPSDEAVRLIQGSHIVLPRLYAGEHAFILQNDDRRVVFMIPFEERYTLVGTTDIPLEGDIAKPHASDAEVEYLCRAVNRYLQRPVRGEDVVWRFAGVRPLYDDGTQDPSAITRDYVLRVDAGDGASAAAPVLSVYGGKITTYRRLAEHALEKLAPYFPGMQPPWTAGAALPGSEFGDRPRSALRDAFYARYPDLPRPLLRDLFHRHGSLAPDVLGEARTMSDLGEDFGGGLTAREVDYFVAREWAQTADDVLWRRSKAGLRLDPAARERLAQFMGRER
jgi:glycerol-3-phosphate dehydrogenase